MLKGHYIFSGTTDAQLATATASDFVIVKSSQNTSYVNPKHDAQVAATRAAGKLVGHFHFAWPPQSDPVAQANAFVAAAKPQPGDIMAQDLEANAWTLDDAKAAPNFLLTVRDVVRDLTGATTWHYTNKSFGKATVDACTVEQRAQLFTMPLWIADYSSSVTTTLGWPTWTAWQKSASFDDAETFNGDAALWRSLGVPEDNMALTLTPEDLAAIKALVPTAKQNADQVLGARITEYGGRLVWDLLGLAATRTPPAAPLDVDGLAASLKASLGPALADELAKRLAG